MMKKERSYFYLLRRFETSFELSLSYSHVQDFPIYARDAAVKKPFYFYDFFHFSFIFFLDMRIWASVAGLSPSRHLGFFCM